MNDMSRRRKVEGVDKLNFYEWMFLRSVSVAWTIATGEKSSITRDELLDVGMKVMPQ
jgi:hypothetical protein